MNNNVVYAIGAIFVLLGAFAVWSLARKAKHFKNDGVKVTAEIASIEGVAGDAYGSGNRKVFVSYMVNEQAYIVELNYFSNSMRVGGKVEIFVSNTNHQDIIYAGNRPLILGFLFVFIGVAVIVVQAIIG